MSFIVLLEGTIAVFAPNVSGVADVRLLGTMCEIIRYIKDIITTFSGLGYVLPPSKIFNVNINCIGNLCQMFIGLQISRVMVPVFDSSAGSADKPI